LFGISKSSLFEDGEGDEWIVIKMYVREVGWTDAKWMEVTQRRVELWTLRLERRVELWTLRLAVFTPMLMLPRIVTDEELKYYLKWGSHCRNCKRILCILRAKKKRLSHPQINKFY
jgi:hypothetical protein